MRVRLVFACTVVAMQVLMCALLPGGAAWAECDDPECDCVGEEGCQCPPSIECDCAPQCDCFDYGECQGRPCNNQSGTCAAIGCEGGGCSAQYCGSLCVDNPPDVPGCQGPAVPCNCGGLACPEGAGGYCANRCPNSPGPCGGAMSQCPCGFPNCPYQQACAAPCRTAGQQCSFITCQNAGCHGWDCQCRVNCKNRLPTAQWDCGAVTKECQCGGVNCLTPQHCADYDICNGSVNCPSGGPIFCNQ